MKAIVTVGVSASGKSTWALKHIYERHLAGEVWREINRDNERRNVLVEKTQGQTTVLVWKQWKWKWEDEVTERCDVRLAAAVAAKENVVISDTNLNPGRRAALVRKLEQLGYEVEVKVFEIDFAEACRRDAARENGVGVSAIAKQFEQFNAEFVRQYVPDINHKKAVIVDIDGTLAHTNGKRGPFDWTKVFLDSVDEEVAMIVRSLSARHDIIVMSGRDECCREETLAWLDDNRVFYDKLFMRKAGDTRKDSVVKSELFWAHVAPKYNVITVIDDRPQVCRMWRSIGLKVLQLGNPYIEF